MKIIFSVSFFKKISAAVNQEGMFPVVPNYRRLIGKDCRQNELESGKFSGTEVREDDLGSFGK